MYNYYRFEIKVYIIFFFILRPSEHLYTPDEKGLSTERESVEGMERQPCI